jgi:hypothetical protein
VKIKLTRRTLLVILSVLLVASISLGVTLAFFVKETERRANHITFGNLSIQLTEAEWEKLGPDDKITYPGRKIAKDPQVTNTGGTDAYLYLEVGVPRGDIRIVENGTVTEKSNADLFTFTVNKGWELAPDFSKVSEDGQYSIYIYAYTAAAVEPNGTPPPLFDHVAYVDALEGQPSMGSTLEIRISATGIQAGYLNESGDTLAEKIINAYAISQSQAE